MSIFRSRSASATLAPTSSDLSDNSGLAQVPTGPSDEVAISLNNLVFGYGDGPVVLEGINLEVRKGEILCLIGPSGCGKSTILNLVAGMIQPTGGTLTCYGESIHGLNRRVTYMTQKDTLLPWRTALDNAALPLEIKGVGKAERYARARVELDRVGVGDFEQRRPHQLSGGMRSRLSLARALMSESDIFLMDEPFAAIDALLRVRLQQLLLTVWQQTHNTLIYVTHDLNEAIALGHRVAVMSTRPGTIALEKIIEVPQPRDVARFRNTPEAQALYVELWDSLEQQLNAGSRSAGTRQ